jgi:tetratricopeptide (TPR) repeat protein
VPLLIEALSLRSEVHAWLGEWTPADADATRVVALAEEGSGPWLRAQTIRQVAAFAGGRPLDGVATLEALASIQPAPGTASVMAPALGLGVLLLCLGGQVELVRSVLDRAAQLGEGLAGEPPDPGARGWLHLGHCFWAAWYEGDPWGALGEARDAESSFVEAGDTRRVNVARAFAGMCQWSLGKLEDAERVLVPLPNLPGERLMGLVASLYLTLVLVDRGALDQARRLAEARARPGETLREAEAHWLLGEIAFAAGDLPAAERELDRSLEGLRALSLTFQIAAARLASVYLAQGRVADALPLAREARALQRAQGGHGQRGTLVRLVYAEALVAAGDHEEARREIADTHRDLQERAARIHDEATRQTFLEQIPEHARVAVLARALAG